MLKSTYSLPDLPPAVDLETVPVLKRDGVAVAVCGLAEHSSGGGDDLTVSPEAITSVWQEILGEASLDASCRRPGSLPSVPGGAR